MRMSKAAHSMLVVFMPSRMEVIRAKSATESRAKYSCERWKRQRDQSVLMAVSETGLRAYVALNSLVVVVYGLELKRAIRAVDLIDEL